jgi:hypothetical protein
LAVFDLIREFHDQAKPAAAFGHFVNLRQVGGLFAQIERLCASRVKYLYRNGSGLDP